MKFQIFPQNKKQLRNLAIRWTLIFLFFSAVLFLSVSMPGKSFSGVVGNFSPKEQTVSKALSNHVYYLADTIGVRSVFQYQYLKKTEDYITNHFESMGYEVKKQFLSSQKKRVCNIEVEKKGTVSPKEIIIIGAHYDSHSDTPGADDNASGVASLLELAKLFSTKECDKTVRFVAFVNEENPFNGSEEMGSLHYARRCSEREENITAMFSLETMGYYRHEEKSQYYPFIFGLFYSQVGDFIAFVGNMKSRSIITKSLTLFRENIEFPTEGLSAPGWIKGIGWSDHWSFWQYGYKGIMITDTAPYRNKNYHQTTDTPETLNYDYMARVVVGLEKVFEEFVKGEV